MKSFLGKFFIFIFQTVNTTFLFLLRYDLKTLKNILLKITFSQQTLIRQASISPFAILSTHRLNMKLDLPRYLGSCIQLYSLAKTLHPPFPTHLGSYTRSLLVSNERRHLFVTPCYNLFYLIHLISVFIAARGDELCEL